MISKEIVVKVAEQESSANLKRTLRILAARIPKPDERPEVWAKGYSREFTQFSKNTF